MLAKEETGAQIVRYETERGEVALSTELVRRLFCPTATPIEAYSFIQLCRFHRLNPHLKEVYLVKYSDRDPATVIISKEAWTARADQHKEYRGFKAGIILLKDDQLEYRPSSFRQDSEILLGGWCEVYRADRQNPIRIEVSLQEYDRNRSMWNTHKATMIRKVAVSQAHREAFPGMFQGLYEQAEASSEGPIDDSYVVEGTVVELDNVNTDTGEIVADVSAPPRPKPRNPKIREQSEPPASPPKRQYNAPRETLKRMNDERTKANLSVEQVEEWVKANFEVHQIADLTEPQVEQVIAAILNQNLLSAEGQVNERDKAFAGMLGIAEAYSITRAQIEEWVMETYQLSLDAIDADHANSIRAAIQTGLLTAEQSPGSEVLVITDDDIEVELTPAEEMEAEREAGNTLTLPGIEA